MSDANTIEQLMAALALPASARVGARVPKKLLVEQGAPTATDKRAINDGVESLTWFAACKPATIGVPAYKDEVREYIEVNVLGCVLRETKDKKAPKTTRLIELIHRAVPYPVVLIASDADGISVSAGHKRAALNEAGKVVVENVVSTGPLAGVPQEIAAAFLASIGLPGLPRLNLMALYEAWLARIEAVNAARITGGFRITDEQPAITARRTALAEHSRLAREMAALRAQAKREKQLQRTVALNIEIKRLEAALTRAADNL